MKIKLKIHFGAKFQPFTSFSDKKFNKYYEFTRLP